MRATILVVALAATAPAAADPNPPAIKDAFAFDAMKPKKACAKVTGALLKKIEKSYACAKPSADSASGKPLVAEGAIKKGSSSTYLVLATKADCEEERETQLANGDG